MRYEDVSSYVQSFIGQGDELQAWTYRLSKDLQDRGVFSIDPTRGRLLELVARLKTPRRVLEVGAGAGYSALWFMKGMGGRGSLEAIEVDRTIADHFQSVMEKAGLKRRVKVHLGPALTILRKLKGPYDIVFIDAEKDEYAQYLQYAMKLTKPGAVILADNMFWRGAVLSGGARKHGTDGIIEYTRRIFSDSRLSSLILPLGDGLAMSFRMK